MSDDPTDDQPDDDADRDAPTTPSTPTSGSSTARGLTTRDRAWDAAIALLDAGHDRLTVADLLDAAGLTDGQHETARNVLNAMAALGHLEHTAGSRYWTRPTSDGPAVTVLRNRNADKWTFSDPVIRAWVEARLEGRVLNLFAGGTTLDHPEGDGARIVRNDVNRDLNADHHFDAAEVADHLPVDSFDTVLLDPPWETGIVKRRPKLYDGTHVSEYSVMLEGVAEVVAPGGRVITFGYDSTGMSATRGFEVTEVAAIHFSGSTKDVTAVVERDVKPCDD